MVDLDVRDVPAEPVSRLTCPRCGTFEIAWIARDAFRGYLSSTLDENRYRLSGKTRGANERGQVVRLDLKDFEQAENQMVDVDQLLKIRQSPECSEFRDWLQRLDRSERRGRRKEGSGLQGSYRWPRSEQGREGGALSSNVSFGTAKWASGRRARHFYRRQLILQVWSSCFCKQPVPVSVSDHSLAKSRAEGVAAADHRGQCAPVVARRGIGFA